MIDDENLDWRFAGSSFSPSCSWIAVKMEGPGSAEESAPSARWKLHRHPGSLEREVISPLISVLSMMSRPSSWTAAASIRGEFRQSDALSGKLGAGPGIVRRCAGTFRGLLRRLRFGTVLGYTRA